MYEPFGLPISLEVLRHTLLFLSTTHCWATSLPISVLTTARSISCTSQNTETIIQTFWLVQQIDRIVKCNTPLCAFTIPISYDSSTPILSNRISDSALTFVPVLCHSWHHLANFQPAVCDVKFIESDVMVTSLTFVTQDMLTTGI